MAIKEMSPERVPQSLAKSYSTTLVSPVPNGGMIHYDSVSSLQSSSHSHSTASVFSPNQNSAQQVDSAKRQNPLIKQFSNN